MKKFLIVFLLSTPVLAEDFEFSIPIKLSNLMPMVNDVLIQCQVMDEDEVILGRGEQHIKPVDGSFNETILMKFDADPGMNPQAASLYKCSMRLHHQTERKYLSPRFREDESDWPIWAVAKPDTNLVYEIEGTIGEDPNQKEKKK